LDASIYNIDMYRLLMALASKMTESGIRNDY